MLTDVATVDVLLAAGVTVTVSTEVVLGGGGTAAVAVEAVVANLADLAAVFEGGAGS